MNVLCIGDIVGSPGRRAVKEGISILRQKIGIDFVIANAENAAGGSGLTPKIALQLFEMGCDVLTLGDHVWDQKTLEPYLCEADYVLRPANFPDIAPGKGYCIKKTSTGLKVGVINILGRVFMRYNLDCPFRYLEKIAEEIKQQTNIIIVDMHAEATSEKVAIGHFIDGKVSAVVGTHTHVQTADEKILPNATAYITDLGMTGPQDSVIGQNKENIIRRFLSSMPVKFNVAKNNIQLQGVIISIDEYTGKARQITRIQQPLTQNL